MNKKFKKSIIIGFLGTTLCGTFVPLVNNSVVYAYELQNSENDYSDLVDEYNFVYLSRLTEKEQKDYKESLKKSVSTLESKESVYRVLSSVDKYIAYEKGFFISKFRRGGSFWDGKGLTVGELGAAINGIVGGAIGGGLGYGVTWVIKNKLKKEITGYLIAVGLGAYSGLAGQIINGIQNFMDIGGHIARAIDANDFYKNNGRINLWP